MEDKFGHGLNNADISRVMAADTRLMRSIEGETKTNRTGNKKKLQRI
jgi:hypothetical protein